MKKPKGEGQILRAYLRDEKIHQGKLCEKLGMSAQGLSYHFTKEILTHEFKLQLHNAGVMLFDKNGKMNLINTSNTEHGKAEEPPVTYGKAMDLYEETISALKGELKAKDKLITVYEEKLKEK